MVMVIFACFVLMIASAIIYWKLIVEEDETLTEEENIDLSKDFQHQLELVESDFRLHKITKQEYDLIVAEIEKNALKTAEEHVKRLEDAVVAQELN